MTLVYADTSAIVAGTVINASDVKTPIDALDTQVAAMVAGTTPFAEVWLRTESGKRIIYDSYGSQASITLRRALGTLSSPSDITNGTTLGTFELGGRRNGGLQSGAVRIQGNATEDWDTASKFGAQLRFYTTPNGSASAALAVTIHQDKKLEIDGDLDHDGSNVGFFGVTPVARPGTTDDIKDALTNLGLLQGTSATPLNLDGGALTAASVTTSAAANIGGDLNHDGSNIGFYGTAPIAKPTVSGSRGGNAALASLCTALANFGLIINSTS